MWVYHVDNNAVSFITDDVIALIRAYYLGSVQPLVSQNNIYNNYVIAQPLSLKYGE